MPETEVINRYFAAMRRGAVAEHEMMALFSDDAVYVEPFSGLPTPARGKKEVRERLRLGWEQPLPELELDVLSIEVADDTATSKWECRSTVFPATVRGTDRYVFVDGLISRLEVTIDLAD